MSKLTCSGKEFVKDIPVMLSFIAYKNYSFILSCLLVPPIPIQTLIIYLTLEFFKELPENTVEIENQLRDEKRL